MGWWSATILGGDGPYDVRGFLLDSIGCFPEDEEGNDLEHFWLKEMSIEEYRALMNEKIDVLLNEAIHRENDYGEIAGQVLGALILEVGAVMPDNVRAFVLASAEGDEWAHEAEDRAEFVQDLIEKVNAYPAEGGVVVPLAQEGLFEKIFEKIDNGEPGLVNR